MGAVLAQLGLFSSGFLMKNIELIDELIKQVTLDYPLLLEDKKYQQEGVTVHEKDKAYQGLTAVQGWFKDGLQIRLIDMEGKILHQWMLDFHQIWPNPTHIIPEKNAPQGKYNYDSQGMYLFEDGSVLVNIEGDGAGGSAKLDKCGNVLWTVDRMIHHSVNPAKEGGFWVPASRSYLETPEDLFFFNTTREVLSDSNGQYEGLILRIGENGEVLKEFSVLQALVDAGLENYLFNALAIRYDDPTHINDVEEVTQDLSAKIEGVEEGDLLVSIRQMHMLAIFDKETGALNWHQTGPWVRQHDPDITPEGNITVFNNRPYLDDKGSNIMEFDPATGEVEVIYEKDKNGNGFYTSQVGMHQRLPNGNLLIGESMKGRAFEVTDEDEIVWEYIKNYNKDKAVLIENVMRIEKDYFQVDNWQCEK